MPKSARTIERVLQQDIGAGSNCLHNCGGHAPAAVRPVTRLLSELSCRVTLFPMFKLPAANQVWGALDSEAGLESDRSRCLPAGHGSQGGSPATLVMSTGGKK